MRRAQAGSPPAERLFDFVRESNRIEGIKAVTLTEVEAHERFLEASTVRVNDLRQFVRAVAGAKLRAAAGMNVQVRGAKWQPPPGGPRVQAELQSILDCANAGKWTPHQVHLEYETLHPFMDGNGRSGRVLWAWQMREAGKDPFALPFLHRFYYEALEAHRG